MRRALQLVGLLAACLLMTGAGPSATTAVTPLHVHLRDLLGGDRDSQGVRELFEKMYVKPKVGKVEKSTYYTWSDQGLVLKFNGANQLASVFLYSEGTEGKKQYNGALPGGLTFDDRREEILKRLGEPDKSIGGWLWYQRLGIQVWLIEMKRDDGGARDPIGWIVLVPKRDPEPAEQK